MKFIKYIPKIAFFISGAALIFSIATLIRTIVIHQTQFIWLSILQVVGTALIMGICGVVVFLSRNSNEFEDSEDSKSDSADTDKNQDNKYRKSYNTEISGDDYVSKYSDNKYDLPEIEDRDMDEPRLINNDK